MAAARTKYAISIYSPLGGQGASFLATQLVHQFARLGPSCLVDLNLDYSTCLHYLNVEPTEAFRKSALSSGESALFSSFAVKVEENYFAVGAPLLGYGQFAEETRDATKELFDLCRAEFDYTVVDLPRPLHVELTRAALAMSDLIIVICDSTDHSVQACVKLKQMLADSKMGIDSKKVFFLFNRAMDKESVRRTVLLMQRVALAAAGVLVYFARPELLSNVLFIVVYLGAVFWTFFPKPRDHSKAALASLSRSGITFADQIPHDSKACRTAINEGAFLDENSGIGKAMVGLAAKIRAALGK